MSKELEPKVTETTIKSRATRTKRVPLGQRGRMEVPSLPGYYMRYINTSEHTHGSRMHEAKLAGYEPVLRKEIFGADCEDPEGLHRMSDPAKPILMKLPNEYREEDLKRKQDAVEALVKDKTRGGNLDISRS